METLQIGTANIPRIGLGTWQLRDALAEEITIKALEVGYRHIDTAQMYQNEAEIGRALAQSDVQREDIWLTTKVWWENLSADKMGPSIEASLEKLDAEYIDLLLIHWPHPEMAVRDYLPELLRWREQGLIKYLGLSNFTTSLIRQALEIDDQLIMNQVEYHPYLNQDILMSAMKRSGMGLTAYSPIAQGKVLDDPLLKELGKIHGKSAVQIALRWLIQQEGVVAIPRTSKPERLADNLDVFDFTLSADEMAGIKQLTLRNQRLVNPERFAPQWDKANLPL